MPFIPLLRQPLEALLPNLRGQRLGKHPVDQSTEVRKKIQSDPSLVPTIVSSPASASETAIVGSSIILMPTLKDRQITNTDMTMGNAEVASTIVRSSILPTDVIQLAEQSDATFFSQALHFSLVGLFSTYEAMTRHYKIIKAANKLKTFRDRQNEKVKELEPWLAALEGKATEAEKKRQMMDYVLKSSKQEITGLKEEKEQLSASLTASKENLADVVKAAKEGGCNEATVVYEVQFTKLENMPFEDGWMAALQAANVPMESKLRKNILTLAQMPWKNQVEPKGLELKTLLQQSDELN